MKLSARNVIKGTIVAIDTGPIMASVKIDIGGGQVITAVITANSAKELGLVPSGSVYAIVKSTEVMLATDDA